MKKRLHAFVKVFGLLAGLLDAEKAAHRRTRAAARQVIFRYPDDPLVIALRETIDAVTDEDGV